MSRKSLYTIAILTLVALLVGAVLPASAQDPVTITWFVGLGTGTNSEQIEVQNQVVADFNAAHDDIELVINIAASNETARDTLSTLLAAGTPPDIVGPVGVSGSNAFADQWLDLTSVIESSGFDISVFDPALVDLYRNADGTLTGLPFAVYPVVTYYNRGLFDEAGLAYPPAEFGAPYVATDGTESTWDYATALELAKQLTVDANGLTPNDDGFDPAAIEQFGLNFQWARIRLIFTDLQPSSYYDAETGTATIPDEWRQAAQWYWDALWTYHVSPNATQQASELMQPSGFASGNLGMSVTPLWYTCCLDTSVGSFEWDIAPVPASFDGVQHVAMDADTFRIVKASANPEAAFTVLQYLVTDAAPALSSVYGAFPALPAAQQAWVDTISARYPMDINWSVAQASLAYANPGSVHHESNVPNYSKTYDREFAFLSLLEGDTGADIDVNAEIDTLQTDLQAIIDEVK
jgi:multiple sugar transport system substrate-binding protein